MKGDTSFLEDLLFAPYTHTINVDVMASFGEPLRDFPYSLLNPSGNIWVDSIVDISDAHSPSVRERFPVQTHHTDKYRDEDNLNANRDQCQGQRCIGNFIEGTKS